MNKAQIGGWFNCELNYNYFLNEVRISKWTLNNTQVSNKIQLLSFTLISYFDNAKIIPRLRQWGAHFLKIPLRNCLTGQEMLEKSGENFVRRIFES